MPFLVNSPKDIEDMLKKIGVSSFEELISDIPEELRLKKRLELPPPLSEEEIKKLSEEIADKNVTTNRVVSFLGAGAYDHIIPSVVRYVISRPEFYTAYTPYQAEVSQGTLQSMYEYQSLICELFDMEVSNASMYDASSALGESVRMGSNITKRKKIILSEGLHPLYKEVVRTYAKDLDISLFTTKLKDGQIDMNNLAELLDESTIAFIFQTPNFFGNIEPVFEIEELVHKKGALLIVDVDPISLGILEPPGRYNADIAIGEGQCLGIPQSFGGPYLGIFTTKREYIKFLPGRLSGKTVDIEGKRGFVMTLQTREQHIRREKATSNICTNEALCALAATVFLSFFGKEGMVEIANHCLQKSHYLSEKIDSELERFSLAFRSPFFKEFTIKCPIPAEEVVKKGLKKGMLLGADLGRFSKEWSHYLLVAVTERRTKKELDKYIETLASLS